MIRILLLAFLAFVAPPASYAAEPVALPRIQGSAPAADPHRVLPKEQARMQRNAFYETVAAVAVAGSAGAIAAVIGGGGLVTVLVVGGALGVVYFASGV